MGEVVLISLAMSRFKSRDSLCLTLICCQSCAIYEVTDRFVGKFTQLKRDMRDCKGYLSNVLINQNANRYQMRYANMLLKGLPDLPSIHRQTAHSIVVQYFK